MKPKRYKSFFILLSLVLLSATGCGQQEAAQTEESDNKIQVTAQTVGESRQLKQTLEYPAMVFASQEAKLVAKTNGTATRVNFKVGEKVTLGQELARIDDVNGRGGGGVSFNAAQVKQAQLAVAQAAQSYQLARTNYQNLLISSEKDLNQALIAKNQADTGKSNLNITAADTLKSAQIAYDTARVATESARVNLENRKKIAGQSDEDTRTNAYTTADSVFISSLSVISGINNIMAFDANSGITINYKDSLSALDSSYYAKAKTAYEAALSSYNSSANSDYFDINTKLEAALKLSRQVKSLADLTRVVLDKTVPSDKLPQSSSAGTSLSGLQSTVAGYQSTANGNISSVNAAKQGLTNLGLNNDSTLTSLEKAYELARQQEESAKQALNNLKSGNKSQKDAAGYGAEAAGNQYSSIKVKIDSQIAVARSQMDIASLSYSNAAVALQSLYDIHQVVTPISGTVTKKIVNEGDTVSAGQVLAIVSQPDTVKLQFYVDQANLPYFRTGQTAKVKGDNREYAGHITGITPSADALTKRFLIEIAPDKPDSAFSLGTVMNVAVEITKQARDKNAIILPLSAIEVGQNASYIMIIKDGLAAKAEVKILRVEGEAAELKTDLPPDTRIIAEGNKEVQEGDEVTVK